LLTAADVEETPVQTEDFGAVLFRMGEAARGAMTASQVSAGRKNHLSIEIYGTKSSVRWDQERPDELWIGQRNSPNQVIVKDPSLLKKGATGYADLPGGHSEGYDDTFKQIFRRFYASIAEPLSPSEYPQMSDGLRQMKIMEAELSSHRSRGWVELPND
jgi:predicted dehydrogenase